MVNVPPQQNHPFPEAAMMFDLERLKTDLGKYEEVTDTPWQYFLGILSGYSPEEIASQLGIAKVTVKQSLTQRLKPSLIELLDLPEDTRIYWDHRIIKQLISAGYGLSDKETCVTLDREIFRNMLDEQRKKLTSNSLMSKNGFRSNRNFDDVYVPLGLVKPKEEPKSDFKTVADDPRLGSQFYRQGSSEDTEEFSNTEFFDKVLAQEKNHRLAIIGEPGAGKTTLLQKISTWIEEKRPDDQIIWVPLAEVRNQSLADYLLDNWLKRAKDVSETTKTEKDALINTFKAGNVWLLLDGVNEMGINDPLLNLHKQITGCWLKYANIILSCRLNVWKAGNNHLHEFEVYRNRDFSDFKQRNQFIKNYFEKNPTLGEQLITELNQEVTERIRDLVKNPLRLTMICFSWHKNKGKLPDTKAELYQEYVDGFYDWKADEVFSTTPTERRELNQALGELAKSSLEQDSAWFRITHQQICECEYLGNPNEEGLGKKAIELGWLNEVGVAEENPSEQVFAFFHPSFQEYFAALAIDDPDFFLKHIPEAPSRGNYRIFESQWYESYLLYLGRNDLTLLRKEDLLNNLMNFQDNLGNLYGFQLFWVIAMGILEYPAFSKSDLIVEIIIDFICIDFICNDVQYKLTNSMNDHIKRKYDYSLYCGENILKDIASQNSNVIKFLLKRLDVAKNNNKFHEVFKVFYAINLIDSSRINLEENILYIVKNGVDNREYIDNFYFGEILKNNYENKPELLRILTEQIKICDDVFYCMTLFSITFKIEPQNTELNDLFIDIQRQCEQDWLAHKYFNEVFISELKESSETCHENQNVKQNQNVKRLSDFDRCLLMLYNHLLEISNNEQEENYSFAIQIIKEIQSASYKKNINSSDIIYFKYLLIELFHFLLKILKVDQAQTEVELFPTSYTLVSRIFRAESKRKNRRALLYKGFRKTKSRSRINKDTNSYTVHLFISFFATVGQKIDLIKDKIIEIFINSLSIESKEGSFSLTGLTRIIQSNIHKMSLSKQEMIDIIRMIKNENIDIVVETEEVLFSPIISLFRDFAKCLDYPEFYQAWYGHPEIAQTLNQQILDLSSRLQPTEKTYPLVINAKSLEKITNENSLSQALCNKIYKRIFPQITDIPKVNDPSSLEREIIKIKGQIQKQNLALIFHQGEPNETLMNVCEQLTDEIYYKFISNQSLEQAIPSQENLVNILQNWINQLD